MGANVFRFKGEAKKIIDILYKKHGGPKRSRVEIERAVRTVISEISRNVRKQQPVDIPMIGNISLTPAGRNKIKYRENSHRRRMKKYMKKRFHWRKKDFNDYFA